MPWELSYHSSEVWGWCLLSQWTSIRNMNSIQVKTKELKNKMYLAHTYRLRLTNSLDSQKRSTHKISFWCKVSYVLKREYSYNEWHVSFRDAILCSNWMFEVTRLTPPLPIKPFGTRTLYQGSIYLQSQKPLPPPPPPPWTWNFAGY